MSDRKSAGGLTTPWSTDGTDVARQLDVIPDQGLVSGEVDARRLTHGANVLRSTRARPALGILVAQLRSFIVALLAVASAVSFAMGHFVEGVAVVAVIVLNTLIGFVTELRAVRSMEALRSLGNVYTHVRREGRAQRVAAHDLVVGDVVILEAGDIVTADLRLLEASRLQANESTLTGESAPVGKGTDAVTDGAPLAERRSMLFKGTAVTRGAGEGIVVAVGMGSELGRISALVEETEDEETPLERRLEGLGRSLAWASLVFVVLVAVVGFLGGKPLVAVIETAIALAVATVPEGLPIVATVALARGMWRMARRNALIENLPAVETLGSTNVILTDKTGTLTENRMTVTRLVLPDRTIDVGGTGLERSGVFTVDGSPLDAGAQPDLLELLAAGALCNDAELADAEQDVVGDPMEVALLVVAAKAGLSQGALRRERPELREEAFDPEARMMATFHRRGGAVDVLVKGAPEAVLAVCDRIVASEGTGASELDREAWLGRARALGDAGLRVLAVATREAAAPEEPAYEQLTLRGLVGFVDPARRDVRESIETCAQAGIRVVMVTGDQPGTAQYIAREVGLPVDGPTVLGTTLDELAPEDADGVEEVLEASVIARSSPEQKLRLLEHYQRAGAVVAMIGDGVNDAPALHRADIGVAMGQRGTQVAREAADMVLQDDRFGTITAAIEQGRAIFDNIRTFVIYLVSCNLSEILTIGVASLVNAPLPILPMQILFLNLVTDVFPALALGVSEGHRRIMEQPPRDQAEPFLTRAHWQRIAGFSVLLTVPVLVGLAVALEVLGLDTERAVTVSFLVLAVGQLAHVFNMAARGTPLFRNHVTRNPWIWGALALCAVLLALSVYLPPLASVLRTRDPGPQGWALVMVLGSAPAVVGLLWRGARGDGRRGVAP